MELVQTVCFGPLPHTQRGLGFHLDATDKGKQPPRIIYGNQNYVIIRELKDLNKCEYFQGHPSRVNVAKFHPGGGWIVSGDDGGLGIVWSSLTQVPKQQINMGKSILDIGWDGEGKRIILGGRGKEERVKIVPWNTNNKLGELSGIAGNVLSVAFRPKRPYHVVAVSEDPVVVFSSKGPPFSYGCSDRTHKGYINCVRFHPSGEVFMTVGKDKQIIVFEGRTGKVLRLIKDKNGHKGTIYSFSFNEDGSRFVTCSADKSVKMWDFEEGKVLRTYHPHPGNLGLEDMQVACTWTGSSVISVSLSGQINFFDDDEEDQKENLPMFVVAGHQKTVNSLELDDKAGLAYTACNGGRIVLTNLKTGERLFFQRDAKDFKKYLNMKINDLALSPCGGTLTSIFANGMMFFTSTEKLTMNIADCFMLDGAPKCSAYSKISHSLFVGTHKNKVFIFKDMKHEDTILTEDVPRAIDISHDDKQLVVGCDNCSLYFYDLDDMKAEPAVLKSNFLNRKPIRAKFNKDSSLVCTLDEGQRIWVWNVKEALACKEPEPINRRKSYQGFHTASLFDCDWNDKGALVTVALDGAVIIWPRASEGESDGYIKLTNAHKGGISRVRFLPGGDEVITSSLDASVRVFQVKEKEKEKVIKIF